MSRDVTGFCVDHRQVAAAFNRDGKGAVVIGESCPIIGVIVNGDGYITDRISGYIFNTAGDNRKTFLIVGCDGGILGNDVVVLFTKSAFWLVRSAAVYINRNRCIYSAG